MSSFPNSPKLLKGGIVLIDPVTSMMRRIIALQYNPDTLSCSFQIQGVGENHSAVMRLKDSMIGTYKLGVGKYRSALKCNYFERNSKEILRCSIFTKVS